MVETVCPYCGSVPDRLQPLPWGDGVQRLHQTPYLCQECAGLAILDLDSGAVMPVPEEAWEPVRQKNPVLWATIRREQERLLEGLRSR